MSNCTPATSTEEVSEQIKLITNKVIDRYRKAPAESLVPQGGSRGNSPKLPGKNSQKRPVFQKITPLGAHVMAIAKLTGRQYQILFMLIRDANYEGVCFTHPDHIASELSMDSSDVRKALKVLDEKNILKKKIMPNKGHCYWLNPKFITAKDGDEQQKMHAIWLSAGK